MKRVLICAMLALGVVSTASAVPPCWPGRPANVATNVYMSPATLSNWWATHFVPTNVASQDYYVAFHATDEYCKAYYGNSAWAVITGPYALVGTVNGTIAGGAIFNCQKCAGIGPAPGPDPEPVPADAY